MANSPQPVSSTVPAGYAGPHRVTQARVVRSEWTKLQSLRSTRWLLLAATMLMVGSSIVFSATVAAQWSHTNASDRSGQTMHPLDVAFSGIGVSQLVIAVLGVLLITGEYSTGMIRTSLIAVPKRLPVLWAKLVVYGVVLLVLMLPAVLIAYFASQSFLSAHPTMRVAFSHPGVARTVIGAAVYLMLIGICALAIGAIVRSTAGGIATFAALFFVVPPFLNVLPSGWSTAINPYLPSKAADSIFSLTHGSQSLGPGSGLALFCGYVAVLIAIASVLLVRRDT